MAGGVDVEMPDGTIKQFKDIQSAKDFKQKFISDPISGGALSFAGGDPGLTKDTLDLVDKSLSIKQKMKDLEGLAPSDAVYRGMNLLEDTLAEVPSGEKGPFAIARGYWEKGKAKLGYNPAANSYDAIRQGFARPLIRYLGEKGAGSDKDAGTAMSLLPDITDPYVNRRDLFKRVRTLADIPDRPRPWGVMQNETKRYQIQAPQGNIE